MKIDLYKKEIRALMTCLSIVDVEKVSRQQKRILDKINPDKLYIKLSTILFENTFPGNLGPNVRRRNDKKIQRGKHV